MYEVIKDAASVVRNNFTIEGVKTKLGLLNIVERKNNELNT